jgi:hypothetical protein
VHGQASLGPWHPVLNSTFEIKIVSEVPFPSFSPIFQKSSIPTIKFLPKRLEGIERVVRLPDRLSVFFKEKTPISQKFKSVQV